MDIIIYTKPEVLEHKKGKVKDDDYSVIGEYMWKLHNTFPKNVDPGEKIWFAIKGNIVGFFIILEVDYPDIIFNCNSWAKLEIPIPQKPFQGFKYKRD